MPKNSKYNFAIIFDMDGVVVDNTDYHVLAWMKFTQEHGHKISAKTIREKFMGRLGRENIKDVLGAEVSDSQIEILDKKREAYYRKIYSKAIKPVEGLPEFLKELKKNNIKIALATAAPPANVKFTLTRTGLKKYFKTIVDSTGVKRGKPNPDVFLKAARVLKVKPRKCIVIEDTFMGTEAGKRAGMKVIAIATSHPASELRYTDLVINNFKGLSLLKLSQLLS
jgi:beta-phosphoglucomutase family hydrolase